MTIRVGDRGRTMSSLHPQGFVRIEGKRYDARSVFEPIERDTDVVVTGGDLQGLNVRKITPSLSVEKLPGFGNPVHSSFHDVIIQQEKSAVAERDAWRAQRRRWRVVRMVYGLVMGAPVGAMIAAAGLWIAWDYVSQMSETPWNIAAGVVAAGAIWAVAFFCMLDRVQQHFMDGLLPKIQPRVYDRLTLLSTALGLLGGTIAAAFTIPSLGVAQGAVLALMANGVLGLIVPAILILNAPAYEE